MKKVIFIDGMTCNHCKMSVEKSLRKVEGVIEANVSLFLKQVELEVKEHVKQADLEAAIIDAGYQVRK